MWTKEGQIRTFSPLETEMEEVETPQVDNSDVTAGWWMVKAARVLLTIQPKGQRAKVKAMIQDEFKDNECYARGKR